MKKLLPLLALALPLALPAGDDANLKGRVMSDATVQACVQAAKSAHPGLQTVVQSETVSTCIVSGSIERVTIFQLGHCPGNILEVCMPAAFLVATVDVGCEGEISTVTCYAN